MEDEDPVVQEIPVFLSQALSKHLYIYQYPVRPANRDWKDVKVKNASIKPKNQLVRLEIGLDTYSDKYCPSKGEQIAINTDGQQESSWHVKEKDRSQYFRNGIMDKIVYESSTPCVETQHYTVAILQDKELHCTSIQGVVQMRPSYSYYDKQDKRKHDKNKSNDSDDEEKDSEVQQITVKFARQETEVAKKAREKSFETMSHRLAEEPWYDAMWRHHDTDQAELERLKLFSATSSDGSALRLRGREYVRALVPPAEEDQAPDQIPSLQDQVREILINGEHMSIFYYKNIIKNFLFQLYLFTQHTYIDRRKVAAAVRLPPDEVLQIIRTVAKYNPQHGWELLIPPDLAFEAKYPEVMQRQNLHWEARQRLFNEMLIGESVPKRQRKKSQRESVSSDTMLSPKTRCNSVSEEDSDRKRHKNKSATGSGKRTRNISSSSAHDGT
ncbi:DNA-directed RNA polymerase III subunit RPC5 [Galleria mellonella]|uniref:DNA-directed RNA polymerase III subunit RPC5 n=1 Tax=Galleria mellonella TaxID=7137 RepID=A0ABM3MEM3_GALME|nr:DNA-directed RNA polymerase III subunit RPC5 [Galleria mellonella]